MAEDFVELRENNPYSLGIIFTFDDGDFILESPELVFEETQNDRYFVVEQGDNLWTIANEAYGDSKWYWVIQQANNIEFAFDIEIGTTLYIPDLETFKVLQQ